VLGTLNEYQARLFVADKALDQGRGGVSRLSELTGMSRTTITKAVVELNGRKKLAGAARGQIREAGGGRKKVEESDPGLHAQLAKILEETSAGDPMSALRWTNKSTEAMAEELTRQGHPVSDKTVARCLRKMGYSMQLNQKTREGPQHQNRDEQFRYLNRQEATFRKSGDPVLSVDAKKKENVGPFKNGGRTWRPKGKPYRVNVHDFPSLAEGKAIPYGTYEIGDDRAVVNVGVTHDTAEFAVGKHPAVVETGRMPPPAGGQTNPDLCGFRRKQQQSVAKLEATPARTRRRTGDGHHGLPLPARNQQVEQDRAPAVFVYQSDLERAAADQL